MFKLGVSKTQCQKVCFVKNNVDNLLARGFLKLITA